MNKEMYYLFVLDYIVLLLLVDSCSIVWQIPLYIILYIYLLCVY